MISQQQMSGGSDNHQDPPRKQKSAGSMPSFSQILAYLYRIYRSLTFGLRKTSDDTHVSNVGMLGLSGHGKSSFVRSILWLKELIEMEEEDAVEGEGQDMVPQLAAVPVAGGVGNAQQCTLSYKPYPVNINHTFDVMLGDLRGVSSAEIENPQRVVKELVRLSEGKIREDEIMSMDRSFVSRLLGLFQKGHPRMRVTQFILVHRFDKVKKIFDEDAISRWVPVLELMRKAGLSPPLVVITRCDAKPNVLPINDPNETVVSRDMGDNYSPVSVDSVRKYIQLVLNVDSNDIFFVENYLDNHLARENEERPAQAAALLTAFTQAVKRGVQQL